MGLSPADPKRISLQFNAQITEHNISGLAALMTTDHRFIDRDEQVVAGKDAMIRAWTRFFVLFPEYRNTFTQVEAVGELVVMYGYATWKAGEAPDYAIWTARVEGGLVAEWRIYTDNEEKRRNLGLGGRGLSKKAKIIAQRP